MNVKYFWYALPVLLAMVVGYAMMNGAPGFKVLLGLGGIALVAAAFYVLVLRAERD